MVFIISDSVAPFKRESVGKLCRIDPPRAIHRRARFPSRRPRRCRWRQAARGPFIAERTAWWRRRPRLPSAPLLRHDLEYHAEKVFPARTGRPV
jgi:hypothetical protein